MFDCIGEPRKRLPDCYSPSDPCDTMRRFSSKEPAPKNNA